MSLFLSLSSLSFIVFHCLSLSFIVIVNQNVTDSLTDWVNHWQGYLSSGSGQLKISQNIAIGTAIFLLNTKVCQVPILITDQEVWFKFWDFMGYPLAALLSFQEMCWASKSDDHKVILIKVHFLLAPIVLLDYLRPMIPSHPIPSNPILSVRHEWTKQF